METFFQWFKEVILPLIQQAVLVITVVLASRDKTSKGENPSSQDERNIPPSPEKQTITMYSHKSDSLFHRSSGTRSLGSAFALACVLVASIGLAMLQFGPERSAPLSTGEAASIAESLALLAMGFSELLRR